MSKTRNPRGHIIEPQRSVPPMVVWGFGLAGLVALTTLFLLLWPSVNPFRPLNPANDNRTWITSLWTAQERSAQDYRNTVAIMRDNGIKAVYVQMHTWDTGGLLQELPFSAEFIQRFRAETDQIALYGWFIIDSERLRDEGARSQLAQAARQSILEWDLSGVHIQARSVGDNNEDYVSLLREVRRLIGDNIPLSVTVPPDRSPLDPDVPSVPLVAQELTWSQDYKRRILLNVDEIVLMGHASSLQNVNDYEIWLGYQVAAYANVMSGLQVNVRYIVALPTYAAEVGHDPAVENVNSAIRGIERSFARSDQSRRLISGVGLYPWEQTDLFELEAYWEKWVQRRG